jgi:pyruvate/2-oxoglutarate dehydrogenase complex dihydrolipoamide acyltransferase (E2) component
MAHVVVMPRTGQTMEEGSIVEWLKQEGDAVERGEILLTIQSDKATIEVESDHSGILMKILATPEDGDLPCLEPIAIIAAPGETVDVEAVLDAYEAQRGRV